MRDWGISLIRDWTRDLRGRPVEEPGIRPRRRRFIQALGAGCITGLAGCADADTSEEVESATIALAEDPTKGRDQELYGGLTPYTVPVLENLTRATPDLNEIEPELATEWASKGETIWEFEIREDTTFHNGTSLDAYVIEESLSGLLAERPMSWADLDEDSFSATDEHSLEITTTKPSPYLPGNLAHPVLGVHYRGDEEGNGPIGTGPFKTGAVSPDEPITTTAYDDYWGNSPYFDELVFTGIPDDTTRSTSMEAGEVDVGLDLPAQGYDRLKRANNVDIRAQQQPRTAQARINIYKPPTDNRNFRLAMQYALDQEAIVENIAEGVGTPANGPFPPVIEWSAHDTLPWYGPDMERASELVEESGYDGEELSIVLASGTPIRRQIAEYLQERFGEIGIDVDLRILEPATYYDKFIEGEANLVLMSSGSYSGATDYLIAIYHTQSYLNKPMYEEEGTGILNLGGDFDEKLDEATSEFDQEARYELFHEIQHTIMEESLILPFYYREYILGTKSNIEGPVFHAIPRMIDWTTMSME